MQAIVTKYLPATDTKGSRIKATCEVGSITIGYPHELSASDAYAAAAMALVRKVGWLVDQGSWIAGSLTADSRVFVWFNADNQYSAHFNE